MRRILLIFLAIQCSLGYLHAQYLNGDGNGDGKITLKDVTMLKDLILDKRVDWNWNADPDVNGDGRRSVTDVTELVKRLPAGLNVDIGNWGDGDEYNGTLKAKSRSGECSFAIQPVTLTENEEKDVYIELNNPVGINGLQFTLYHYDMDLIPLESGAYAELIRTDGKTHLIDNSNYDYWGGITFLAFSTANIVFPENTGNIVRVRVKPRPGAYSCSLSAWSVELSDSDCKPIYPEGFWANLSVVPSGIDDVVADDNATVNVYSLDGILVKAGVKAAEARKTLPKGIYIINNRKFAVR